MKHFPTLLVLSLSMVLPLHADLWLPAMFSDHMVLQRDLDNPVWGTAEVGETVVVKIDGQVHQAEAGEDGAWKVRLKPMSAGGPYELTVEAGEIRVFEDVLIGEVWFCSGQSNMEWPVSRANHSAKELADAEYPEIRLLSVPKTPSQEPLKDFTGAWATCSAETVKDFSAVGFFFGRRLYQELKVPIGLVDNAWGGSAAEAWVPREKLLQDERYHAYLREWDEKAAAHDDEAFARKVEEHRVKREEWKQNGRQGRIGRSPRNPVTSRHRPENIYNGVLAPTLGYGLRGFIWYQGESNEGRAYDYRYLFPMLIETFREQWGQGDFPFYWVQLANYRQVQPLPLDEPWAWVRESQTLTLDTVPNGGQAVIIDVGEANNIHPKDKQTVADRLVRIALARDYGMDLNYQSPRYASMQVEGHQVTLEFKHVSEQGLETKGGKEPVGFAVAGEDRVFHWAEAEVVRNSKSRIKVWCDQVPYPVAVRYAWANNPVCNLYDRDGLPVTPFRTDDWPPTDAP